MRSSLRLRKRLAPWRLAPRRVLRAELLDKRPKIDRLLLLLIMPQVLPQTTRLNHASSPYLKLAHQTSPALGPSSLTMGRTTTILSGVFLSVGGFLFGYDSGIITSTIALPTFEAYFDNPSNNTIGGIVSSFQGGAILGTILNMLFADWLGRRRTILAGSIISLLGAALQASAVNMPMLIVGRFIGGVAVGQLTSTIPMYAFELSEPSYRGILSELLQWMLSWGFLVARWLGYGCSFVESDFSCESAPRISDFVNEQLSLILYQGASLSLSRTYPA